MKIFKYISQYSGSVLSESLQFHGLQHDRLLCPLPIPGVYSNLCPLSRWCHPTISSFVIPFSSCLQCFPASGSFPMSQLFTSSGQRIEFHLQHHPSIEYSELICFRMDWLDLLAVSRVFSNTIVQKHQFFGAQLSSQSNSHICTWPLEKP